MRTLDRATIRTRDEGTMTTRQAVKAAGVTLNRLTHLLNQELLAPPPAKDKSGCFVWTPEDVQRLRQAAATIRPYRAKPKAVAHAS